MDAQKCLLERRSIRKYKRKQIDSETLGKVLEAGMYAPSAMNMQSAVMVAVLNANDIFLMSKINAAVMGSDSDPFYGAPAVVVVFGDSTQKNYIQDASLVMGNLMNSAYANGLGSCWINRAKETFETPEGKALMAKWNIDEKYVGVANCILGYPNCDHPAAKPRKENYLKIIF